MAIAIVGLEFGGCLCHCVVGTMFVAVRKLIG
jgi:hypothetical protein